jgi:hypothetical protein
LASFFGPSSSRVSRRPIFFLRVFSFIVGLIVLRLPRLVDLICEVRIRAPFELA